MNVNYGNAVALSKIKRLPANTKGRDFIVGDLHGCYDDLFSVLNSEAVKFDESVDRVICVGDLIDRGPQSVECVNLLSKPWFHAIQGNHEEMMYSWMLYDDVNVAKVWFSNGGMWAWNIEQKQLSDIAARLFTLPKIIVVGEGEERYNVVHAELYHPSGNVSDADIDNWTFDNNTEQRMLWGRSIRMFGQSDSGPAVQEGLSLTYVGHSPVRYPMRIYQQMYIDGGCCFYHTNTNKSEEDTLMLACHQEKLIYRWVPLWKKVVMIPYDQVRVMPRQKHINTIEGHLNNKKEQQ